MLLSTTTTLLAIAFHFKFSLSSKSSIALGTIVANFSQKPSRLIAYYDILEKYLGSKGSFKVMQLFIVIY